ncbi:MAG: S41 family peptidase, partial [Nitrospinota bacterium]
RSFSQSTTNDLKKHIDSLFKAGATKLIVDLRNNPGGLLEQAIDVSSLFIKKGEVLVKTEGRLASLNKTFKSSGNSYSLDIPIIILINKGSASASEIVAGALQDLKRALIIGNQSFGKASVQIIIPLKNDAGIRLTTAHYFTPLGKEIHETGIEPNLIIANIVKKEKLSTNSKKLTEQELIRKMQNKKEEKGAEDDIKNLKRALVDLENDKQLDEAVKLLATKDIFKMIKEVNLNQKEQVANATH